MKSSFLHKFNDPVFTFQYYQVVRYVIGVALSIILVRSGLPQNDIGHYEIWMFIVNTLTFFWSAGIKNAFLSYFPKLEQKQENDLIYAVFWLLLSFGLFLGLLLIFIPEFIISLFIQSDFLPCTTWIVIYLVLSVPVVLTENVLYIKGRIRQLVSYTHWSQGCLLALFLIAAIFDPSLSTYLTVLVLATLLRFVYLVFVMRKIGSFSFQFSRFKLFVIFSIPIVVNMLLGSIMDFIDGWFVTKFFDTSFFPVFRYGARELPFSTILFSSLSAAMIPVLIKEGVNSANMRQRADKLMHILFPASIVCMLISPFVFPLVYTSDYTSSAYIFNIYLLIITSRVLMPQTYNFALHQHKVILWSSLLEIVINIVMSYWWMKIWGVFGLAFATVLAYFMQKAILIWYNYKENNIPLSNYIDIKSYLLYCVILFATFFITFNYF